MTDANVQAALTGASRFVNEGGWIGVDLDGTLAHFIKWVGPEVIGAPIPAMVARVKDWLAAGKTVKILTARINVPGAPVEAAYVATRAIKAWCKEHIGQELDVTCSKDTDMVELWDDRAVQVVPNTGELFAVHEYERGCEDTYYAYCGSGD